MNEQELDFIIYKLESVERLLHETGDDDSEHLDKAMSHVYDAINSILKAKQQGKTKCIQNM